MPEMLTSRRAFLAGLGAFGVALALPFQWPSWARAVFPAKPQGRPYDGRIVAGPFRSQEAWAAIERKRILDRSRLVTYAFDLNKGWPVHEAGPNGHDLLF